MKASRKPVDGDFVLNDVSHHARMRVKERGLPIESLSGHAPGVKTVRAPSGKVVTVMSKVEKPRLIRAIKNPTLFREDAHFGAAVFGAPTHSVDAKDLVPYVIGKRGATIKRVCEKHGVRVTVHGSTLRIEGDASAAAAAEFESIIDRKRRALRWDGAEVVDVTGYVGRVIGNIARLEREFNVNLKIDCATARILPAMNSAVDIHGARARIEAMDPRTIKGSKHL